MDNLHILVVDDNHINRLFFESALKKLSCTVVSAVNGFEAIEQAKIHSFDLILMDIRMDGMDGVEAASQIKRLKQNNNTPIIAVSAEAFNINQSPHFSASLLKPVKQEELSKIIIQSTAIHSVFDHQKALEISHQDEAIVLHLRKMFVEQLREFEAEIQNFYENQQFNLLQEKLHQLLGSAKICAAENIIIQTEKLKSALKEGNGGHEFAFQELMKAVKQAQNNFNRKSD